MIFFYAFVFGAVVGSFLNVCIHRLPEARSIIRPRSRCPHCGAPIRVRDNLPILSWILLRGRCRSCSAWISPRYPLVEGLTGALAIAVVSHFGLSLSGLTAFLFVAALIVVTFIDLDHQIIPNVISIPGIPIGFALSFLPGDPEWHSSLLGILVGGGILWAVAEGYYRLTGREGMGFGDVKLLAMIGAFLGWRQIPVTLMLASFAGSLVGGGLMLVLRRDARVPIPFGPFLAAGAVIALFYGEALIHWYVHLFDPL